MKAIEQQCINLIRGDDGKGGDRAFERTAIQTFSILNNALVQPLETLRRILKATLGSSYGIYNGQSWIRFVYGADAVFYASVTKTATNFTVHIKRTEGCPV